MTGVEILLWLEAGFLVILSAACIVLSILLYRQSDRLRKIMTKKKESLLEDLELATSEQLLGELRKRPFPYILIRPVEEQHMQGLNVEINGIPPVPTLCMLQTSAALTLKQLKERGYEIPEFPNPFE